MNARYALYFVPEPSTTLAVLGSALLGRESETGAVIPQPDLPDFSLKDLRALTVDARRYGLHATLKAPFFLKPGITEYELLGFANDFVMGRQAFVLPGLTVQRIGSFFALAPSDKTQAEQDAIRHVNTLAADIVTLFDPFRAAPTAEEIARRNPQALNERQRALFAEWGYPYVFDEYRFHITLTDKLLDAASARRMEENLKSTFAAARADTVPIASICVCKQILPDPESALHSQDHDDSFMLLKRFYFPKP